MAYKNIPTIIHTSRRLTLRYRKLGSKTYPLSEDYSPEPKDVTITVVDSSNNETIIGYVRFNFNEKGKIVYNMLTQLGYEIKWIIAWTHSAIEDFTTSIDNDDFVQNTEKLTSDRKISARAILALIKIIIDWYVPTQYEEFFEQEWEQQMERSYFNPSSTDVENLVILLSWVNYEQDRFTGAWIHPTGPNEETSEITITDITDNSRQGWSKGVVTNDVEEGATKNTCDSTCTNKSNNRLSIARTQRNSKLHNT